MNDTKEYLTLSSSSTTIIDQPGYYIINNDVSFYSESRAEELIKVAADNVVIDFMNKHCGMSVQYYLIQKPFNIITADRINNLTIQNGNFGYSTCETIKLTNSNTISIQKCIVENFTTKVIDVVNCVNINISSLHIAKISARDLMKDHWYKINKHDHVKVSETLEKINSYDPITDKRLISDFSHPAILMPTKYDMINHLIKTQKIINVDTTRMISGAPRQQVCVIDISNSDAVKMDNINIENVYSMNQERVHIILDKKNILCDEYGPINILDYCDQKGQAVKTLYLDKIRASLPTTFLEWYDGQRPFYELLKYKLVGCYDHLSVIKLCNNQDVEIRNLKINNIRNCSSFTLLPYLSYPEDKATITEVHGIDVEDCVNIKLDNIVIRHLHSNNGSVIAIKLKGVKQFTVANLTINKLYAGFYHDNGMWLGYVRSMMFGKQGEIFTIFPYIKHAHMNIPNCHGIQIDESVSDSEQLNIRPFSISELVCPGDSYSIVSIGNDRST